MSDDSDFDQRAKAWRKGGNGSIPHAHIAVEWWRNIHADLTSQTIVKRVLGRGTCSLWYGESGSAKTFLAFYLAFCVALGRPFFGRKVKQGLVIYIAAEGASSMRQRIEAFRKRYDLPDDDDVPFALIAAPVNLLDPDIDLEALIGEIKAATAMRPDMPLLLIIVDTLSRTLAGGNENQSDHMGSFILNVDRLRRETEAHVAIVHHAGKTASQGARGHSLLRAAVDTEIEVVRSETLRLTTATVSKQRDLAGGDVFAFRLHVVELGYDEDGELITSCALEPLEAPAEAPKPRTKPRPLPPEYLRAVDFLRDIVAEIGKPLDRPGFPHVMTVSVDQWRDHLQRRGLYEPGATGRSRFLRMKERLIGAKAITVDGDRVWAVPRPSAAIPFPGGDG